MSKKIILNFNADGTLNMGTSSVDEIRQGDKGVVIEANFAEKNNVNYVARLNFTRHDTKHIDNVLLTPDPTDTHKYTKVLDSLWYFAINGDTTLTVFLTRSGETVANGQFTFSVQKTDFTGDTTITPDEYEELLELIAGKLDIVSGIVRLDEIDSLADFEAGQVLFVLNGGSKYDNHTVLVKVNSTKTDTDLLFDFSLSSKIVDDVEVTTINTAASISYKIDLLNEQEEVITTFTIAIPRATNTKAGLMGAVDKIILENIPNVYETKEDANAHKNNKSNPHEVTKAQVGLGNVTNDAQVKATEKGVASGVATLDSNAKIPTSQLPDSVLGQLHYKGVFNASTGTSGLTKEKGDYYVCQVGGSKNPDGTTHSGEPYAVGDWSVYNGSSWDKVDNTDAVSSVQGRTGAVVITKADLSIENVDNTSDLDKPISNATAVELAKKQNKVKVSNVAPNPSDYEEGDVIFVPSVQVGDDIIGNGLKEELDVASRTKTLKVDFDVVASKDYVNNKDYLKTQSTGGATSIQLKEWVGTQAQFDSITTKDANTRYTIIADGFNVNLSAGLSGFRRIMPSYVCGFINFDEDNFDFANADANKDFKIVTADLHSSSYVEQEIVFYKGLSNPLSNVKRIRILANPSHELMQDEMNVIINGQSQSVVFKTNAALPNGIYFDIDITEDCDLEIDLPNQD